MEETKKMDIRALETDEIADFLARHGEKKFRAKQIYEWLWNKWVHDFDKMTSLSLDLRNLLKEHFTIFGIELIDKQISRDGTQKLAFRLHDGLLIEGVLIPSAERSTACISSQAGCPLGCTFCATGKLPYQRNLSCGEIYDQFMYLEKASEKAFQRKLNNLVFMGMGEPLLNYDPVSQSIERLTHPKGRGFSPQRITLSTIGLPKMIKRMADDGVRYNLAVSLHSAIDSKRSKLMPVQKNYSLKELGDAISYFHQKTQQRITFEYLLLRHVNDQLEDAQALAAFTKIVPCKINLIEYNPIDESDYQRSDLQDTSAFMAELEKRNLIVNMRKSKGSDISGACGQLANKYYK